MTRQLVTIGIVCLSLGACTNTPIDATNTPFNAAVVVDANNVPLVVVPWEATCNGGAKGKANKVCTTTATSIEFDLLPAKKGGGVKKFAANGIRLKATSPATAMTCTNASNDKSVSCSFTAAGTYTFDVVTECTTSTGDTTCTLDPTVIVTDENAGSS